MELAANWIWLVRERISHTDDKRKYFGFRMKQREWAGDRPFFCLKFHLYSAYLKSGSFLC